MRFGRPFSSMTRYFRSLVSPSWSSHFSAFWAFWSVISLCWWLFTASSMAASLWNGLVFRTMVRLPIVISPRLSVWFFLSASFIRTSRIFFDFSATSLMSSS